MTKGCVGHAIEFVLECLVELCVGGCLEYREDTLTEIGGVEPVLVNLAMI